MIVVDKCAKCGGRWRGVSAWSVLRFTYRKVKHRQVEVISLTFLKVDIYTTEMIYRRA